MFWDKNGDYSNQDKLVNLGIEPVLSTYSTILQEIERRISDGDNLLEIAHTFSNPDDFETMRAAYGGNIFRWWALLVFKERFKALSIKDQAEVCCAAAEILDYAVQIFTVSVVGNLAHNICCVLPRTNETGDPVTVLVNSFIEGRVGYGCVSAESVQALIRVICGYLEAGA